MPAKKSGTTKSRAKTKAAPPRRREIGAVVCLFLALFSLLGFIPSEGGVFIDFFGVFMRGLVGGGFYILIPTLLLAAWILGFHRGRPVQMRLICTLLLPVFFGALLHTIVSEISYEWKWSIISRLYLDGLVSGEGQSGGVIGGLLAIIMKILFGKVGTIIVLICTIVFLVMAALNVSPQLIADWFKNRPIREYEPMPEPEPRPTRVSKKPVRQKRRKKIFDAENQDIPVNRSTTVHGKASIDIPVDDPPNLPDEKPSFFDPTPKVKTPDQVFKEIVLSDHLQAVTAPPSPAAKLAPDTGKLQEDVAAASEQPRSRTKQKANAAETEQINAQVAENIEKSLSEGEAQKYIFPPTELLSTIPPRNMVEGREEMALNAKRLASTLDSFNINAKICNVTRGPSVTRYELELEQGVKLKNLTNLADDIALSLGASGVRIAPIPNKISIVGIEVPNKLVNIVCLRELIESPEFKNSASKIAFTIGKDIGGNSVVGDISKLPHLLIAGTTGSGKSVCMNSLILSLLYKASPDELRLIMIDPKMIELGIYNGIPHLLIPVVTDPKKASGALQWAVAEMLKRYKLFAEVGARDLKSYNAAINDKDGSKKLPQIVILIDELADLMLVAAKEVEESICRVAQMGRASGIHLIIATQRPSADVITGLMKANIPSRIAFAVDSALNSRIILDTTGAEKLVGKGDMLYFPIGAAKPRRVQGTFVTDKEREQVVSFVKERGTVNYSEEIISEIEKAAESKNSSAASTDKTDREDDVDELFPDAVEVILEAGQASVSMLQRRLKLGYSRAARLIDQMEDWEIVGPFEGSKPRQLLITRDQWIQMQGGQPENSDDESDETEYDRDEE